MSVKRSSVKVSKLDSKICVCFCLTWDLLIGAISAFALFSNTVYLNWGLTHVTHNITKYLNILNIHIEFHLPDIIHDIYHYHFHVNVNKEGNQYCKKQILSRNQQ